MSASNIERGVGALVPHMLSGARREFAGGDPAQMARLSGSEYLPERHAIRLCYLNTVFDVSFPDGEITGERTGELNQDEETFLLQYLHQAKGISPAGRWMAFAELPNGMFHDAPFKIEALRPLEEAFGSQPQQLIQAALQLGGKKTGLAGDASVAIPVFPHLLVAVVLWVNDEEFPARASMLFDTAASSYLSTASLYVLGIKLSIRLRQAAGLG
jgi:hypothetical protein